MPGSTKFSVQNYDNGTSPNQIGVDWYDIEYPRQLKLINDSLLFKLDDSISPGFKMIKIENADASVYLIYKTEPDFKKIETYQVNGGNLIFADSVAGGESYVVIKKDRTLKPKFYGLKQFKNLRNSSMQAEYIAITHPKFWNEAQNYVNEIGGLFSISTQLINVEDIFDEFGFGYPDPHAIRLFCQSAFVNWQAPKPSYLVLLGDANYDYKQYRFKNDGVIGGGNYVPSFGDPVSDNWFAVWDENALPIPQLFVGRLPINSSSELQYYLSKVKNNINAPYNDWNKRYLFFSGGRANYPEEIQQLKNVNDNLINSLIAPPKISGFYKHFYKTTSPQSDFGPYTSNEIQKAISEGGIFISYIGHSGTATWDNSINEVSQLKNTVDRNPLITDFGCSTNKFAEPDIVCFGERFVLGENGQALGYVGNSSLGFTSSAYAVPQYFYESLVKDSATNIGKAHLAAKIKMFNQSGSSDVFKVFALTNSLIGDPIVSLKIPPKPNLKITPASIQYSTAELNEGTDSLAVRISISNLGLAITDSFTISITHIYKNEVFETKSLSLPRLEREDTLTAWIKIKSLAGEHSLNIILDPDNKISEIYENDNQSELNFTIVSNVLRDNFISEVENSLPDNLFILNPVVSSFKNLNVRYQISNTKDFSTATDYVVSEDSVFTKVQLPNLLPDYRYWFRYKVDNETAQYAFTKSFKNTKSEKFLVSDSASFFNQEMNGIQFQNSVVKLSNDSINISVLSAGWYAGATCLLSKNGTNLLSNTFFAGMGIAVFNETTLEVDTVDWYQLFGNPTAVQKLADFINAIPVGKIVAMGVADDARNNLSANLINAIKSLGSTKIDQLQFRGSWAIIGKKGGAPGSAIEVVKGPYDGNIIIDTSFFPLRNQGTLTTTKIGPSNKWKYAKVKYLNNEDSKILIRIDGSDEKLNSDSLFVVELKDSVIDLSSIDQNKYPFLQLNIEEIASTNRISPELYSIGAEFTSTPELAINYQVVSTSRDTVIQGDSLDLKFYVYNVGESSADSFHVLVDVMKEDNSSRQLLDTVIASLDSMQRKLFTLNYKTNGTDGKGNMGFKIKIDPENHIRELYKDNNEFTIPFYTKPDTSVVSISASTVSVTFDNTEILNGDFVSSNPNIKVNLQYPTWFAVSDTSSLSLLLDNQKIPFTQLNIKNDSANRTLTFEIVPLLGSGEHQFKIFGNNVYGKLDNQPGFERVFVVSNELAIMNCYNYPNPIKDNTYFTFKLPQLPEELTIRVYTIAGRLVKEIKKSSAELSMDFNRIYWDTKDQDGNFLANGVYLYKVIVRKDGKSESITQKLAIVK
ncbi:MAG: C25 family cysteine peptidase [Ignavibacteriaceae bacterium]